MRLMNYETWMQERADEIMKLARWQIAETRTRDRELFMQMVTEALAHETNKLMRAHLEHELRKVRRALGLDKRSAETIREQTRDRVRRHRKRKAQRRVRAAR